LGHRTAAHLVEAHGIALHRRPAPHVWSGLEYACHVRDVFLVLRARVLQALRDAEPAFTPMGRNERVVHDRYAEQVPADVARQVADAASMLAFTLDGLGPDQWLRTCVYGYPAPARRTLAWVAEHALHEGEHHLCDLEAALAAR
ncbi:MAG: DinB family protein, partial [Acidimicrobiales bacterium]